MFPLYKIKMDDGYSLIFNINQISTLNKIFDSSDYELIMANGTRIRLTYKEFNRLDDVLQKASERE